MRVAEFFGEALEAHACRPLPLRAYPLPPTPTLHRTVHKMSLRDDVLAELADADTSYAGVLARTITEAEEWTGRPFDAMPTHMSLVPPATDLTAYLLGLRLLDEPQPPTPQGVMIAGVILARHPDKRDRRTGQAVPLYSEVVVQLGRRGTKTTSIEACLLGMCETRERTTVVSTAQDGTRASQFMRTRLLAYENRLPIRATRNETDAARLATIGLRELYKSQGREYVHWLNRSRWQCAKPESGALRGAAADVMWFDEAGEVDPATTEDLVAGALPLLDTRPMGQAIISGTPSEDGRVGLLWDYLTSGRADPERVGIVDFGADDYTDPTDEATWWRHHPGLAAGVTTVEVLRSRLERMALDKFAREYLCIWPITATTTALDPDKYAAGEVAPLPGPPTAGRWALAFDCDLEGRYGAIWASVVLPDGRVHSQCMDYRPGIAWMPRELAAAGRAHPHVTIGYDPIGANARVAQEVQSMPRGPRRQLRPLQLREVAAGATLIIERMAVGAWEHAPSKSLDLAAESAAWRNSGDSRLFKRTSASVDISSLIAASESAHLAQGVRQVEPESSGVVAAALG